MGSAQQMAAMPMKYLDKAMSAASSMGLVAANDAHTPAIHVISGLAEVDEARVLAIGRVLQQSSHFNSLVRDEIAATGFSQRYESITDGFTSISEDAERMVRQLNRGTPSWRDRLSNFWMKLTRGDIPTRFNRIKRVYLDVTRDAKEQVQREKNIGEIYVDFRSGIKEGEILAHELCDVMEQRLTAANRRLSEAEAALSEANDAGGAEVSRMQLSRDEALRQVQDEEERYQIAKDLADNLKVSYSTSEVVMARLKQTTDVKGRVYAQAVTFFSTNESVFTALSAAFNATAGLHETTQTLNSMKQGINQSMETLADLGHETLREGLRAGYGPTINAESVQRLVDSVVAFQEESRKEITEMRRLSTVNAAEIARAVEDGKQRYAALLSRAPEVAEPA